jgi:hypothetical protein
MPGGLHITSYTVARGPFPPAGVGMRTSSQVSTVTARTESDYSGHSMSSTVASPKDSQANMASVFLGNLLVVTVVLSVKAA